MLRRGAKQERIEKHLKEINDRDKERTLRENADRGKQLVNESKEKYVAELERRKKDKGTSDMSGGIQDTANLATTTSHVAADVQDTVADLDENDEEYEDDDNK